MAKSVKLEQETYDRLSNFRAKTETFSQSIARLIDIGTIVGTAGTKLGMAPLLINPLPLEERAAVKIRVYTDNQDFPPQLRDQINRLTPEKRVEFEGKIAQLLTKKDPQSTSSS